jgi:hypothetical protein
MGLVGVRLVRRRACLTCGLRSAEGGVNGGVRRVRHDAVRDDPLRLRIEKLAMAAYQPLTFESAGYEPLGPNRGRERSI